MKFCMRAHIEFEAVSLGHAAQLLEDHFRGLVIAYIIDEIDEDIKPLLNSLEFTGEIDIRPLFESDVLRRIKEYLNVRAAPRRARRNKRRKRRGAISIPRDRYQCVLAPEAPPTDALMRHVW